MREQRSELPSGRFSIAERIVDESLKILCLLRDDAAQWSTRVAVSTKKPSKLSLRLVTTEFRNGVDGSQVIFRSLQPILSLVSILSNGKSLSIAWSFNVVFRSVKERKNALSRSERRHLLAARC